MRFFCRHIGRGLGKRFLLNRCLNEMASRENVPSKRSEPACEATSLTLDQIQTRSRLRMKTCTVSEAKSKLGELADAALKGQPTVIVRGGKLVILTSYELPNHADEFDALIQAGRDSPHRLLTSKVLDNIWRRGRGLAKRKR